MGRRNDPARWATRRPVTALVVPPVMALRARAVAQPTDDYLTCYKLKNAAARRQFTVTVAKAAVAVTRTVKVPARLGCLASSASGIASTPPGVPVTSGAMGDLLCYK